MAILKRQEAGLKVIPQPADVNTASVTPHSTNGKHVMEA